MKNIMIKTICAISIISVVVLACTQSYLLPHGNTMNISFDKDGYYKTKDYIFKLSDDKQSVRYYGNQSVYGAYLAGHVAHIRQDYENAAEYYKIVMEKDPNNAETNKYLYALLTTAGKISEAAVYAQKDIDNNSKNSIAPLVVAINDFKNQDYQAVHKVLPKMETPIFQTIVVPLLEAWTYVGENKINEAMASLNKMDKNPSLEIIKLYNQGLMYEVVGDNVNAEKTYNTIINNKPTELTYRILEIITNFYVRKGDKQLALAISKKYMDNSLLSVLLANIEKQIDNNQNKEKIIDTPAKGLAEAMFNVGALFRTTPGGNDFAQIYISISIFLNPQYNVAKLALANILDDREMYDAANKYYEMITEDEGSYFIAQVKIIGNLNKLNKKDKAEKKLRNLLKYYPNNTQLLIELGDLVASMDNNKDAIKIYKKAIDSIKNINIDNWPLYYSLGVAYDRNNQKEEAEKYLSKALDLSQKHPLVLNYIGYSWLIENKNTDEAIKMILDAYEQVPYEGHIIDSLGWVYYRTGNYDKSIEYLEQASDLNPGNAVISDHLGDAYWYGGRKNEAVFQWKHALTLKEDAELVDYNQINKKIDTGEVYNQVVKINDVNIENQLKNINVKAQ